MEFRQSRDLLRLEDGALEEKGGSQKGDDAGLEGFTEMEESRLDVSKEMTLPQKSKMTKRDKDWMRPHQLQQNQQRQERWARNLQTPT